MASYAYTTEDEVNFMRELERDRPNSARNYAAAVLRGRRWDSTVDVAAVEAEARRILSPVPESHPAMRQ